MLVIRDFSHTIAALAPALLALVLAASALACGNGGPTVVPTPTPTPASAGTTLTSPAPVVEAPVGATVTVGASVFPVELAISGEERRQGLSGTPSLDSGTGMLFVFDSPDRFNFWMKDMHYPLDILWIGADCSLVDISRDAPFPEPGGSDSKLPRYSPGQEALFVLEINGGESARLGLTPGDAVAFTGAIAGKYGC